MLTEQSNPPQSSQSSDVQTAEAPRRKTYISRRKLKSMIKKVRADYAATLEEIKGEIKSLKDKQPAVDSILESALKSQATAGIDQTKQLLTEQAETFKNLMASAVTELSTKSAEVLSQVSVEAVRVVKAVESKAAKLTKDLADRSEAQLEQVIRAQQRVLYAISPAHDRL